MKTKIFSFILAFTLFVGCNNDDDGSSAPQNDTEIRGTWHLTEQRNTSIPRSAFPPESEEPIEIVFLADVFSGSSANNTFSGVYVTNSGKLRLRDLTSTDNQDTPWATQFYFGLSQAFNSETDEIVLDYEVEGNTLILGYTTDSQFIFEKQ
ncbi:MAG: META domain-containing protein [Flavobacteriaceae bacterium]|nr:META domain-containing protein [Flavobacteriaceae bacterium]